MKLRPLFLIGLPKSGTTLVQRLLASHPKIATTDEPWILLPMTYALKHTGSVSEYGVRSARLSLEALIDALPNGIADYHASLRSMTETLYGRLSSPEATFFLDKTPRYHLILDELIDIFPDATFIFILRNPLSVISSIIEHNNGRISGLAYGAIDVRQGYPNISAALERLKDRAVVLNYDTLVTDPDTQLDRLLKGLGLTKVELSKELGRNTFSRGDKNGAEYTNISVQSIEKWRKTLATPIRKNFALSLIKELDADVLKIQGFEKSKLQAELHSLPVEYSAHLVSECCEILFAFARIKLQRLALNVQHGNEFFY